MESANIKGWTRFGRGIITERVEVGSGSVVATPEMERQIDENLRLIYQQCLDGEMPERLQILLRQLDDESEQQ